MRKFALLILSIVILLMSLTLISCNDDKKQVNEEVIIPTIYTQEVVDEKYLFKKISDASAIYYKSSVDGEFGDENYLFETTILPSEYTEVEYIESTGNNQKLAKRLVDNSIGIIDYDNTSFTVLIDNSFNFKCGNSVGHYFDEGKVITTVSEKQDGDTLYK